MISQRSLKLLSKLAARDLANAERRAADALARVQALEREAAMIEAYRLRLVSSLRGQACQGYDFRVTTGFVSASLRVQFLAESAKRRGEEVKVAAFDRLAAEMQRRDALDTAHEALSAATLHSRERQAERLAIPLQGGRGKRD